MDQKLVCVTGASGFIASWLVKLLLERGYHVRGTVRSLGNAQKISHLKSLAFAEERLQLVEADLLAPESFSKAFDGCDGVFHTASPVLLKNCGDPEAELIRPAVDGTLNVLKACAATPSVRKVIVTSSMAAVAHDSRIKPGTVVDESYFSDPEFCKETKKWYVLSKTLAEEAAWKFAKENGLNMIVINPAMVIGTLLQPTLNTSSEFVLDLIDGSRKQFPNGSMPWVGVKDTAEAHILAYENPEAAGRYVCVENVLHYKEFCDILRKLFPELPVPTECEDSVPSINATYGVSPEKLRKLGLRFQSMEEIISECVNSLKLNHLIA